MAPRHDSGSGGEITALADQCVMCGLCLPQCPTYAVHALEGRSPRGRIALMRRLDAAPSDATAALMDDVTSCLSCGRCEAACPSQVRYAQLLPLARARLRNVRGEAWTTRVLRMLARRPRLLRGLLRAARALAPAAAADATRGGWRTLLALAKSTRPTPRPQPPRRETRTQPRGRVLLLTGCVGSAVEGDTHAAAATLLARRGYDVALQPEGLCCGSLARQAGAVDEAERDAARLRSAVIGMRGIDAAVGCASGCIAAQRQALAGSTAAEVHELLAFLARTEDTAASAAAPQTQRVAFMLACTQRALDGGRAARHALSATPGVELVEIDDAPGCCGAGAIQFIADPETAGALRRQRVAQVVASGARCVATTNTGCRLQLQLGLAEAGLDLAVAHPAVIMLEASRSDGARPACDETPPATA